MPVSSKTKAPAKKSSEKKVTKTAPVQKAGAKSKKAAPKKVAPKKETTEKNVRSFKVMLPGTENYVGRFTGLTPYQAANKALSKYYRETKKPKSDIQFSIRESTRGSKRSTYTYNGNRQKLQEPVKYTISNGDGEAREIIKKFKNRLTKVKKHELAA